MRADLGGHYGENGVIYTPNINSFQTSAFTFTHAYTQQALCGPTRASFLTGTRPDTTRIWYNSKCINSYSFSMIIIPIYILSGILGHILEIE